MIVDIDDVIDILVRKGVLKGRDFIDNKKPGHSSRCTCQACGYTYDDCICDHNSLLAELAALPPVRFYE